MSSINCSSFGGSRVVISITKRTIRPFRSFVAANDLDPPSCLNGTVVFAVEVILFDYKLWDHTCGTCLQRKISRTGKQRAFINLDYRLVVSGPPR